MSTGIFSTEWFVDVRDCACLHVAALLDRGAENQGIFAFAEPYNWTYITHLLRTLRPQNAKLPSPPENEGRDLSIVKPVAKAKQLLRLLRCIGPDTLGGQCRGGA
ncbi:uncharacterized protein A1O9_06317 [Exophiala aquamarina CBS 119918]|uniref:Uncharacterized protein n=1 Tax=Exophiala aquamarina CBS 119918 TaxID=1182545 RepID=A0A072PEU6_9EURO|nr:uncharacterized protein A1O9_06317 [Exophiala aquamarina CBS 119918]KEF58391.1 hypothetical protein A1O9_06317 [Exophiala aquamarina CBS 119918]